MCTDSHVITYWTLAAQKIMQETSPPPTTIDAFHPNCASLHSLSLLVHKTFF
jgi:hypothetical protein